MSYRLRFNGHHKHWSWTALYCDAEVEGDEDTELAQFYLTDDAIEYLKARGAIMPKRVLAR